MDFLSNPAGLFLGSLVPIELDDATSTWPCFLDGSWECAPTSRGRNHCINRTDVHKWAFSISQMRWQLKRTTLFIVIYLFISCLIPPTGSQEQLTSETHISVK